MLPHSAVFSMLHREALIILIVLMTHHETAGGHVPENSSALQMLGLGMKDIFQAFRWCPGIFGFPQTNAHKENLFCRFLMKLQSMYKEENLARAYYGGPAYHTYMSGFEPLTLLAGLAFLAFLLQTLHALLYRPPATTALTPVGISRRSDDDVQLTSRVLSALESHASTGAGRSLQQDNFSWASLIDKILRIVTSFWSKSRGQPCKRNSLCRLLGRANNK